MKKLSFYLCTALLLLLALLLGWLVVFTEAQAAAEESLQWTQFLGRFHPVILHLPVGLFVGLFVIELAALRKRNDGLERSANILVWLMTFTSVMTAYLGLLLASSGDYSGETLWLHKWLGILFSATALLVTFFKLLSLYAEGKGTVVYRLLMIALFCLLPVVGHYGGNLTHGSDYLIEYAPAWMKKILESREESAVNADSLTSVAEGNLFTQQIQPMLDQYCVQCHGIEKQKSKYRLDTYEYLNWATRRSSRLRSVKVSCSNTCGCPSPTTWQCLQRVSHAQVQKRSCDSHTGWLTEPKGHLWTRPRLPQSGLPRKLN
jgi:uncharacterized membrane protein